jgi:predicted transposase/invertase (TIGR01784 family)
MTRLALWGGYMTGRGVDIVTETMAKDEIFSRVMEAERDYWGDSRNRFIQLREEKRQMDELYAQRREGRAERRGRLEGEAKGIVKGIEEGIATVARAMLEQNLPLEIIKKTTGLSENEIASLRGRQSSAASI